MSAPVILLAGPIAVGKTTVAELLAREKAGHIVSVRQALAHILGISASERAALQRGGADLDRRTAGRWLVDYLIERMDTDSATLIVDSLRTVRQTEPILKSIVDARLYYLNAHEVTRRRRYSTGGGRDAVKRSMQFDEAMNHPTEIGVVDLRRMAHRIIDTDDIPVEEVAKILTDELHR